MREDRVAQWNGLLAVILAVCLGCEPAVQPKPSRPAKTTQAAQAPPATRADQESRPQPRSAEPPPGAEVSLARNFYFIFDGSGSMQEKCRDTTPKIEWAKKAVKAFVGKVPEEAYVGLFIFDTGGARQVLPTGIGNRSTFLDSIDAIRAAGGTPLTRSIHRGVDELVKRREMQLGYGDFRLVVITDGQAKEIPNAGSYAEHFGIPIYTIGLCMDEDHELRKYSVSYRDADSGEDLERALEETAAELAAFAPDVFQE